MHTTQPEGDAGSESWALYLAVHPVWGPVARRTVLFRGSAIELGRDEAALGDGAFADSRVSRRHARIEVDGDGVLRIADLGSVNGTHVNGARVAAVTLAPRDVIRVGGVLLVAQRIGREPFPAAAGPLVGCGAAVAQLHAALADAADDPRDVVIVAEQGAGGAQVAQALLERRAGISRTVELGLRADRLPATLTRALEEPGGTLLVTGVPAQGTPARRLMREVLAKARDARPTRVVWLTEPPGLADLRPDGQARWLRVPPLRERPEDLPLVALDRCAGRKDPLSALHHAQWLALLRADWPGNVEEFHEALDRALQDGASEVGPPRSSGPVTRPGTVAVELARTGRWFRVPGEERVSLHRRPVLARIVAVLARVREQAPGEVLSRDALIAEVWPGTRFVDGAGENRLHVALSSLRALGLRALVERHEDGYRLDPSIQVQLSD